MTLRAGGTPALRRNHKRCPTSGGGGAAACGLRLCGADRPETDGTPTGIRRSRVGAAVITGRRDCSSPVSGALQPTGPRRRLRGAAGRDFRPDRPTVPGGMAPSGANTTRHSAKGPWQFRGALTKDARRRFFTRPVYARFGFWCRV